MSLREVNKEFEKVQFFLSPILIIYSICIVLFLLDTYLLPDIFSGYGSIEPEYRPVEQATRLAYLLVVTIAWIEIQNNKGEIEGNSLQIGKVLFSFGLIMIFLENNWDLTLRESMFGRFAFAVLLGSALLWLSWFIFDSDWRASILFCTMLGILALSQIADTFHDNKGGDLLDNEVAETIGTTLGFEESSELVASWVLFHAVWLWHNRNSAAIEFWRSPQAFRLVMGLLFLGIGTGFQAYKEFHFISNEISFLGIILMGTGTWLIIQQLKQRT